MFSFISKTFNFSSSTQQQEEEKKLINSQQSIQTSLNKPLILWNRISTNMQSENNSITSQAIMSHRYIDQHLNKNQIKLETNATGSAYKISNEMNEQYKLLLNFKNSVIICYSVDRFCRNVEFGTDLYYKIKNNGSKLIFISDDIDTSINEDKFFKALELSQNESVNKSKKQKDAYKLKLESNCINNIEHFMNVYQFVKNMMEGAFTDDIDLSFIKLVDWYAHPDWVNDGYRNTPIKYYNTIQKNNREYLPAGNGTIESCVSLLNLYKVEIPVNMGRKKWNVEIIECIFNYINNMNSIMNNFNSCNIK